MIIFIFFGYHFTWVTYIQFTVINEGNFLHIYFKWGIFIAFEPKFAKQLKGVFAIATLHKKKQSKNNSVLDIGGFLKEFNILYRFTQDNSTSQFIINLLLNLSLLK